MSRYTLDDALRGTSPVGLRIRAVIRLTPGADHGLVLSQRHDSPGVLGVGTVDRDGDSTAVALNEQEATALRDALTAWLEEPTPEELSRVAPDPWFDPDAASAAEPPPF